MVTVLFVGAVLTVVASTAAFLTVQEFRASADDRRGSKALAYAEAGVDRIIYWLRSHQVGWNDIVMSGCTVGGVTYDRLDAGYNNPARTAAENTIVRTAFNGTIGTESGAWAAGIDPLNGCPTSKPSPRQSFDIRITSTGSLSTGTRVINQAVRLTGREIPIGMNGQSMDANGNISFEGMTLLMRSILNGRKALDFSGVDPWYEKSDFYPCTGGATPPACFAEDGDDVGDMRAAAHTSDRMYSQGGRQVHPPVMNCTADKSGTDSAWDGSVTGGPIPAATPNCAGQTAKPPTSRFTLADYNRLTATPRLTEEDHNFFREIARESGLYCKYTAALVATCTVYNMATGTPMVRNIGTSVNNAALAGLPRFYVAYFDFPAGTDPFRNEINWSATYPSTCSQGSGVVVIRNGSVGMRGGADFSGAMFLEEGRFDSAGSRLIEGLVLAKDFRLRGSPTFRLTQCWIDNFPGPFITTQALNWSEIDR